MAGVFLRFGQRNIEQPQTFGFRIGLILEKAEKERALFGRGRFLAAVKIPEERLAGATGLRILFGAPDGPDRRPIALDAFAVGQHRLNGCEDLKAGVAVEILAVREERPEIESFAVRQRRLNGYGGLKAGIAV